jgi:hypothetical protein
VIAADDALKDFGWRFGNNLLAPEFLAFSVSQEWEIPK